MGRLYGIFTYMKYPSKNQPNSCSSAKYTTKDPHKNPRPWVYFPMDIYSHREISQKPTNHLGSFFPPGGVYPYPTNQPNRWGPRLQIFYPIGLATGTQNLESVGRRNEKTSQFGGEPTGNLLTSWIFLIEIAYELNMYIYIWHTYIYMIYIYIHVCIDTCMYFFLDAYIDIRICMIWI